LKEQNSGKRVRIFFQDEARVGQQGTLTRVWAPRGSRPRAIKQTEYKWVYLWAAVEPASGELAAMITPDVNTQRMNQFLEGLSSMLDANDLAIVVLDNAGWHRAKALTIPQNLVLLPLPSYSPELNPSENLWQWLRSHQLANRIYPDYDDLLHAAATAMSSLNADRIRSVCACSYLTPPN
jgi:putative transposase